MSRLKSVDSFRAIAILFVIAIHTSPFESQSFPIGNALDLATIINQISCFAVPLFFVLSGYFWAKKFENGDELLESTVRMCKRITFLFIAWSAIYLLPTDIALSFTYGLIGPIKQIYWNLVDAVNNPITTIMVGTKVHLWFLVGLICSLSITAVFVRFKLNRLLVVVAVVLYLIGLAGKAYSDTPIGFHANFNFRNGPFFSLIFFVTGYFLQKRQVNASWFLYGCLLAVLGFALQLTESLFLHNNWGTKMAPSYVIGTYFFGVGVALISLSNVKWLQLSVFSSIGPLVLGIYASHMIFVDLLRPLDRHYSGNSIWDVTYLIVVFFLSLALSLILLRYRFTKKLVV